MKTAVFIPDPIFDEAEKVAQRKGISRSQLYAEALQKLLDEEITARLNELYGKLEPSSDPVLTHMQALSIEPEVWEEAPKRKSKGATRAKR
ncbi:MAG: ChpI protein [Meiothermus sp.]